MAVCLLTGWHPGYAGFQPATVLSTVCAMTRPESLIRLRPLTLARLAAATLCAALLQGCPKPVVSIDGGLPIEVPRKQVVDAGEPEGLLPDGGLYYPPNTAGEPCPPEAFGLEGDAGLPENAISFGLCVALRSLNVTALLNSQPAPGLVDLRMTSAQYEAETSRLADGFGKLDVKVMKARYEILSYHPAGIFPTHFGFQDFGIIDLNTDQQRTLNVDAYPVRGNAFFAGLPFHSTTYPPDVTLHGYGLPPSQLVSASSQGGGYEVALMAGTSSIYLSTPPDALQGTELLEYPLNYAFILNQPSQFDIDVPGNELEGDIRIDGVSLPDRRPGEDFRLQFTPTGEEKPNVVTHHEGGVDGFHSLVPKGKYSVKLTFEVDPHRSLPAQLYNKQVAPLVDLNQPATLYKDFTTYPVEGGILIDGVPPKPDPSFAWSLYMGARESATEPWFLAYYDVPLESASFVLRAFPGTYRVMLNLSDHLADDLVDGWYIVERFLPVTGHTNLPIVVETSLYTGKIFIDGQPPPVGAVAGDLYFRYAEGFFRRRVIASQDGEFKVRVPKGSYNVTFYINRDTYPDYASGPFIIATALDLTKPYAADLNYETMLVTGPLRVGGDVVKDVAGGDDVKLKLRRKVDMTDWEWGFAGGAPNYRLRIPQGNYELWFEIARDAIDGVAWGQAPMGVRLLVTPPKIDSRQ